jgi:hypothetical protein
MSIYRIDPVGGSNGFKVHVADNAGGLRVVGVFSTEAIANAWIIADSSTAEVSDQDSSHLLTRQE